MADPILIEVERSGFVESVHLVDVAVVDASGELVAYAGDPHRPAAFRSSAKPMQARICLESGWSADPPCIAIACASHNGETDHIEQVLHVLSDAGLTASRLQCPPDIPRHEETILATTERAAVYHYCSGKHAAMLATCVAKGWPIDGYRDPTHPLQRLVHERIDALTGTACDLLVDGCGVPTFGASLVALARAFGSMDDGGPEAAAMRAFPFLVAGSGQLDTDLMSAVPHILAKYGAEGLACAASGGYAVALKPRDGALSRAREPALLLVLCEVGLIDAEQMAALAHHAEPPVMGGGEAVGRVRARGTLEWAE